MRIPGRYLHLRDGRASGYEVDGVGGTSALHWRRYGPIRSLEEK